MSSLKGKQIVNTRATHQAHALSDLLRARGAVVIAYPTITVTLPTDTSALDAALIALASGHYHWLVLTSANAVPALTLRLAQLQSSLAHTQFNIATVGGATAASVRESWGIREVFVPSQFSAAALGESLPVRAGERVLLPQSSRGDRSLGDALTRRGASVVTVTAYDTQCAAPTTSATLHPRGIDALTFTSPSTVDCFVQRTLAEGNTLAQIMPLAAVCMGTRTAAAAAQQGFTRVIPTIENTLPSIIQALESNLQA